MTTKDWLVPLVVGGLGFAGMLALPEGDHSKEAVTHPIVMPFAAIALPDKPILVSPEVYRSWGYDYPGTAPDVWTGQPATFVAPLDSVRVGSAACLALDDLAHPHVDPGTTSMMECVGPGLARFTLSVLWALDCQDVDCKLAGSPVRLSSGPRLGMDGYNTTRVTVHVFDGDGELIASNGDAAEQARLTRTYSPEQLPTGTWYLGANATAPPGTQKLPTIAAAFLDQARPLLRGLPEGGVVTTQTDALRVLYGRLYVTLQVDELVHAP